MSSATGNCTNTVLHVFNDAIYTVSGAPSLLLLGFWRWHFHHCTTKPNQSIYTAAGTYRVLLFVTNN